MDKCELNVVGLIEVRRPGKVSENDRVFYSGGVKAEKGVAIELRSYIVKGGMF